MKRHVGQSFRFNIGFMDWMKHNNGKTLGNAVAAWRQLEERKKDKDFETEIPPHNEYNQYMRDFFVDNPNGKMVEARACWQKKRSLPESNEYEPSDLDLQNG